MTYSIKYHVCLRLYKKQKKILILILFSFLVVAGCNRPQPLGEDYSEINVSGEPVQILCENVKPIIKQIKNGKYTLFPQANYKFSGIVTSKEPYWYGWAGKVAPIDLALAWGKLAEPEISRLIKYSQGNRWYYYEYKTGCPVDNLYIMTHSANNHIIPADDNVLKAVKSIKRKEKVVLEGYLVNVKGKYKGEEFWWNTSLSRTDTGDGACEIFYVMKVKSNNKVYQ